MATLAARILGGRPIPVGWARVARAMTQTGGAALAGGLLNMAAMKIIAVMLGPAQVALLTTLQQLRLTALTAATLNGQTALVQGAGRNTHSAYVRTVLTLMMAASAVTAFVLMVFAPAVAKYVGLEPDQASLVRWLALPVLLGTAFVFLTALLNAQRAIGALALVQIVAPAATALLAYPVARRVEAGSSVFWIVLLAVPVALAGAGVWIALRPYRGAMVTWFAQTWFDKVAARHFFAIATSILATGFVSTWSVVTVRAGILQQEGLAVAGQFDAAWAISMSQAGLVLASLQTYYLPALARVNDATQRSAEIRRVLILACAAAAAIIALLAAFKPLVLTLLYSDAFLGAARYLRWTLLGDYLKVSSWILSIPLIAAADMRGFLTADLSAYAVFVGCAAALRRMGTGAAEAAAIAFAAMYAVHLAICAARLRQRHEVGPGARAAGLWFAGLLFVAAVSATFWNV